MLIFIIHHLRFIHLHFNRLIDFIIHLICFIEFIIVLFVYHYEVIIKSCLIVLNFDLVRLIQAHYNNLCIFYLDMGLIMNEVSFLNVWSNYDLCLCLYEAYDMQLNLGSILCGAQPNDVTSNSNRIIDIHKILLLFCQNRFYHTKQHIFTWNQHYRFLHHKYQLYSPTFSLLIQPYFLLFIRFLKL